MLLEQGDETFFGFNDCIPKGRPDPKTGGLGRIQ